MAENRQLICRVQYTLDQAGTVGWFEYTLGRHDTGGLCLWVNDKRPWTDNLTIFAQDEKGKVEWASDETREWFYENQAMFAFPCKPSTLENYHRQSAPENAERAALTEKRTNSAASVVVWVLVICAVAYVVFMFANMDRRARSQEYIDDAYDAQPMPWGN